MATDSLKEYYARRAVEYERIFMKPERQADLLQLRQVVQEMLRGQRVLEIACGTGYWTKALSETVDSIHAVDVNLEVLEIARQKDYGQCAVCFNVDDAYRLSTVNEKFSAAFFGFWWSHIPHAEIPIFLDTLHSKLQPNALIVFLDNLYVNRNSTPISHRDEHGNTYQTRELNNGEKFEVLKNFPTEEELRAALAPFAKNIEYRSLDYYWLVSYRTRAH